MFNVDIFKYMQKLFGGNVFLELLLEYYLLKLLLFIVVVLDYIFMQKERLVLLVYVYIVFLNFVKIRMKILYFESCLDQ